MSHRAGWALAAVQNEVAARTTFVTGVARSGTSLLGRLIATFEGVEYAYEPATFYMICALIAQGRIGLDAALNLLRVYLVEDLLLEAVLGRRANLRPRDDSLTLAAKEWVDLVGRWTELASRADAIAAVEDRDLRLVCKMPHIADGLTQLLDGLSGTRAVVILREPTATISSLVRRGWVADAGLKTELWPYREDAPGVPYWVEDKRVSDWRGMPEELRAAYLWERQAGALADFLERAAGGRVMVLHYEALLQDPAPHLVAVAGFIGARPSALTDLRLAEVRAPAAVGDVPAPGGTAVAIAARLGYDAKGQMVAASPRIL